MQIVFSCLINLLGEDYFIDDEHSMELKYASSAFERLCTSVAGETTWGARHARRLRQRVAELEASPTLAELMTLPAVNCRPLNGTRQGQFAVDVIAPMILVFVPEHTTRRATQQQPDAITKILLLGVTNA